MNKISVIGLGYVGLPTLVAISRSKKYKTVGFDIDKNRIENLKNKVDPINDKFVTLYLKTNKLNISSENNILNNSQVFIICVPTPIYDDYTPNYKPVISACQTIAPFLKRGSHIVLESTVNPGTCEEVLIPIVEKISKLKAGKDFNFAHCPERINPGDLHWTIYNIPRNIGSISQKANKEIADIYRSFLPKATINEVSTLKIAEATKIIENTFRDINIAYVNELAQSFDTLNIDLVETLQAAGNKPFAFLTHYPGCGVGGHCIAVDPYYLIKRASQSGFNHRFLKIAREVNNFMPEYTVNKLILALNELGLSVKNTKICLLGLSYKPNIADLRESPALKIAQMLKKLGADLVCVDPYVKQSHYQQTTLKKIKNCQAILLATAHHQFKTDLIPLLKSTKIKVVIDGRNCLDKNKIEKLGIIYKGIGR